MCHRPHQIDKVTKKNLQVSFKVGGVGVLTWLNFPHQRIFKLGCPERQGISWWVVEVRGLWEPGEPSGRSSLPQPRLPQSSSAPLKTLYPGTLRASRLDWGRWGWGMFNNNNKKGHKPLKGLNSPAQTRMSCKASPGGGHTASA